MPAHLDDDILQRRLRVVEAGVDEGRIHPSEARELVTGRTHATSSVAAFVNDNSEALIKRLWDILMKSSSDTASIKASQLLLQIVREEREMTLMEQRMASRLKADDARERVVETFERLAATGNLPPELAAKFAKVVEDKGDK